MQVLLSKRFSAQFWNRLCALINNLNKNLRQNFSRCHLSFFQLSAIPLYQRRMVRKRAGINLNILALILVRQFLVCGPNLHCHKKKSLESNAFTITINIFWSMLLIQNWLKLESVPVYSDRYQLIIGATHLLNSLKSLCF